MADLKLPEEEEIIKTQEQLDEEAILASDDCVETLYRNPNDPFGNWIASSLSSVKLDKHVMTTYSYNEITDKDNKVIGRAMQGSSKESTTVANKKAVSPSITVLAQVEKEVKI